MYKYAEHGEPPCMVTYGSFLPKEGGSPEESGEPLKGKKGKPTEKKGVAIPKLSPS